MTRRPPIEANLRVSAFYTREAGQYVISCPALRFAVQGKTLAEARREFLGVLEMNLEYWHAGDHMETIIRNALDTPDAALIPAGARSQEITLRVPPELLAAVYGPKQKSQRRKAA